MDNTIAELFETDSDSEESGVWIKLGKGVEVRVARTGNTKYRKALRLKTEPYRIEIANGTFGDELSEKIAIEVLAETILVDWRGVTDKAGEAVPYSAAKALEFLTKYKDFREKISELARDMANYRKALVEEAVKNSPSGSDGKPK